MGGEAQKGLNEEEIKEIAKIYKKETNRPLTPYQKSINDAAQLLCLQNPTLLNKKSLLMAEARKKIIDEGFQFAKGKSRSKFLMDADEQQPPTKRRKLSKDMRQQRMKDIDEDCQDLTERIAYKEKRIVAYENSRDYKKCDEMKEEISALKHQRRQLQSEAKRLNKSNTQSKWYFEGKKGKGSSTDSRSTTPKSDTSDCLSDGIVGWKDKVKGQSTASASSSESTLSTPSQPRQDTRGLIDLTSPDARGLIDLTSPHDSDDHSDEYLDGAPLSDQVILLNTSDSDATVASTEPSIAAVPSDATCTASATLPCTPVANASSLTTLTPASVSCTSPSLATSTMLTDSVGVLTTAALVPQQPPSSAFVIEMLLSQSLQPDVTSGMDAETSSHEFTSLATSRASPSSPTCTDSGDSLTTNLQELLSQYVQSEASGGNSSSSRETSPTAERAYSHHARENSSPSVSLEETNDDQPQCSQSSF
jgi:hypothetical protein